MEDFLQQLPEKDVLLSPIPSKTQITLDDVDKESTFINTVPGTPSPLRLHFCKPASIVLLGDYDHQPPSDTPLYIDLLLVLNPVPPFPPRFAHPQRSFAASDFQNWSYLNKRSLYLAALSPLLSRAFPSLSLHFAWLHGDFDKPLLQLALPPSACAHRLALRLLPALPADAFPAGSLAPARTNVRVPGLPTAGPTWFYNATVLEDLLFPHYAAWLRRAAARAPALRTAGTLVQVGAPGGPHA